MELYKSIDLNVDMFVSSINSEPWIICNYSSRIEKKLNGADFQIISINAHLAQALMLYPVEERVQHVVDELNKYLCRLISFTNRLLITDFEMLFDPRYKIDVIKFFCEMARKSAVAVVWPGEYSNGKLIYARTDCKDYHEYNCDLYQIRIVQ